MFFYKSNQLFYKEIINLVFCGSTPRIHSRISDMYNFLKRDLTKDLIEIILTHFLKTTEFPCKKLLHLFFFLIRSLLKHILDRLFIQC